METTFREGNIEIKRKEGKGKCEYGHTLSIAKYVVERTGVTQGVFGPGCAKKIERAAKRGTTDRLFGKQDITDLMEQPKASTATQYDRFAITPRSRRAVLEAALEMDRDEYLRVPASVDIVPDVPNFRKKGLFVYVSLPNASQIDAQELTPAAAVLDKLDNLPLGVYAGLKWMGKQDKTSRIFSLVSTIQGKRMYSLLAMGAAQATLQVEDYGSAVVFEISSFSKDGATYKGRVDKLSTNPQTAYSQAFELMAKCNCEDALYSTLPKSDMNSNGKHYANRPIRVGKHESAVLELVERVKPDVVVSSQPFEPTAEFMQLQWKLANRVVHGSRMLTGTEQEILLWGAASRDYMGAESVVAYRR